MPIPPSGRQVRLRAGDAEVVVVEVGGGLRSFEIRGEPVLLGYGESEICSAGRGQVLAPWPNRLEDGQFEFEGTSGDAALDEPARKNAIHGLVRWLPWRFDEAELSGSRATGRVELSPQPGYPWRLEVEVSYELRGETSLRVSAAATNRSAHPAPFGIGFHPYFACGEQGADACRLRFSAERRLVADDRGLPSGAEPTAGTGFDFSAGRDLRGVSLDDCFTSLSPGGAGGDWSADLVRGDGRSVRISWRPDELGFLMAYTADTLTASERRSAVALEPMSCAPNAFRSGDGLVRLAPGGTWSGSFVIEASGW